ncbi:unnamed protein product [Colias eurytheme]|nr:unnamed protein product [Colias eurytheme]
MTSIDNLKCVFCNEVFNDKELLQEHFRKHGDPLFDKSSKNKNKTQNEVPTSTEKMEDNELVGCDVCEEVFPTISKAITHKHKVHPDHDAKYFCPWCGKLFTMKHLFNKHLQSNHDGLTNSNEKNFHCDSCSVYFNVPSAMLHHNKFFHRQDTDLNSIGSSKKIKFFNQELVSIFYCPFCGEEYNNKVNLHKHMEDDHGDENQAPEDVLRCPLCEAFFYHLDAYELHLTFHSTEDVYSEQNEMVSEVTEFSLEAVPPIMEKVLSDPKIDPINNFLEMAMSESEGRGRVKTKKHKKHKKSKKETITLDEFLNMNKDVFGDGLNVQGIEEVPTQMVLKKKYNTKKNMASNMEAKNLNSDLAKLKKQGIIIKPKSSKSSISLNDQKKHTPIQTSNLNVSVPTNPNDVISKLLSKGNSEIKIIKKSIKTEPENKQDSYQSNKVDSSSDYSQSLDNASQLCTKENENHDMDIAEKQLDLQNNMNVENKDNLTENSNKDNEGTENILQEESPPDQNETIDSDKCADVLKNDEDKMPSDAEETEEKIDPPLKALQNIGSQLTIKSLSETKSQTTNNEQQIQTELENSDINEKNIQENFTENEDEATEKITESNAFNSLNLNNSITVKAVTKSSQPSPLINDEKLKQQEQNVTNSKSLEALKGLSKFITVKPTNSSPQLTKNLASNEDYDEDYMSADENMNEDTDCGPSKQPTIPVNQQPSNPKVIPAKITSKADATETKNNTQLSVNSLKNEDILKRLTNVTAKSISTPKKPLPQKTVKAFPKSVNQDAVNNKKDNIIEILNIDDSDSEADTEHVVKAKQNDTIKPVKTPNKIIAKPTSTNVPRGLNKNITIKSMSQQSSNYTEYRSNAAGQECKKTVVNRSFESKNVNITHGNNKFLEEQKNLQETIKNLRRHITVKSKNSDFQHEEMDNTDSTGHAMNADEDHDSDSSEGRLKITELNEEDFSDNEHHAEDEPKARVESPHSYNSDEEIQNEDHIDDDLADIESQIKVNPINKTKQHLTMPTQPKKSNISHLSELTIKPLRQGNTFSEDETNTSDKGSDTTRNVANASGKPSTSKSVNQEKQISKNVQSSQKASSSSNQISTVKTVKTYQSQTVIEEITTTVTKTIRTVNTQEVQNTSQNISKPTIRPQKIMNMASNNIRATPIRQASPAVGTKVRNSVPTSQIVSPNTNTIRPSNMIVPVRPRLNAPRLQNPSNIRKVVPAAQNQLRPYTPNRPLKISPQVTNNAKRQSEEASGHFSCFKKPKESLIPVQDIPDMSEDGTVQYSSSQSKSSFSNVTKVLSNAGSTSQTRSETSSSSQQHIAKLSGVSGLKIVKTSSQQSKQVEEKCEVNSPKNDTIAALEKLQRQGLLIKKPRLDTTEYEKKSFSESDGEADEE